MSHDLNPATARKFRVVWKDAHARSSHHVASLEAQPGRYVFAYTAEARVTSSFRPFPAFPDFERIYRSGRLFPFFQNRVMSARRPDFDEHLTTLGLTRDEATPLEFLARSAGRRLTDTVWVVPEPGRDGEGQETRLFLVSGARHIEGAGERIAMLRRGEELALRLQPDGAGPKALLIDVASGESVGRVPGYLLDEVCEAIAAGAEVRCSVEQANGPEAP